METATGAVLESRDQAASGRAPALLAGSRDESREEGRDGVQICGRSRYLVNNAG
jgi:hypothetical protein